ncbi:MAG TPA: carboxypeptidase-like regulatory domain-containing protein, partial [Candidatus Udaeobacter sp.]|nr:carboxypeptidase-like regulatory domain-containing protein [Candidatus Udaeobacter sp.]
MRSPKDRWTFGPGHVLRVFAGASLGLLLFAGGAWPGTTGKISGRVVDAKKQPLAGVNIAIPALHVGAATDADGRFVILQVPPGSWDLRVNLLGYRVVTVQGVQVSADNTATADVELAEAPISMGELVV